MTILSILVFLAPVLTGILFVHLLWAERTLQAILFKIFLGAGLGLGVNSLLYFAVLMGGLDARLLLAIQLAVVLVLIIFTIRKALAESWPAWKTPALSPVQWILLGAMFAALILSGLTYLNYSQARPQGAHDAWSIWNRAARFIYRDPANWTATASPDLYWATHPDYPLLVPLNVAWGWAIVQGETHRIPQVQSALFTFSLIGLMFASVGLVRSIGQASLASIVLMSTPVLVGSGFSQISDIPLSFFILAACVLMYLYFKLDHPVLMILSGFSAGLAAWTKNEGLLFVLVSFLGLLLAGRNKITAVLLPYLEGLAIPMLVVLYFKYVIAPENDIFSLGGGNTAALIADLSRYRLIIQAFFKEMWTYTGRPISLILLLAIYAAILRFDPPPRTQAGARAIAAIVVLQILGYCAIYVLTPHDLAWHLNFSFTRLIFHVYPAALFLCFTSLNEPERAFPVKMQPQAVN